MHNQEKWKNRIRNSEMRIRRMNETGHIESLTAHEHNNNPFAVHRFKTVWRIADIYVWISTPNE